VPFDANAALALLRQGDPRAARALAESAIAANPRTPGAQQILGLAALQMGDTAAAVPALKAALSETPGQSGLWEIYGGALEAAGNAGAALAAYDEAVRLAPNAASGHHLRGITLNQLGRHADAVDALTKATDLDPNGADVWFWRGNASYANADYDAAIAAFETAVRLRGDWADAWLNLAVVKADTGKHEAALEAYQRALDLSPDDPKTLRYIAITLRELFQVEQAETMFKRALDLDPQDAATAAALADMYEQNNRLDEARRMADEALAADPANRQAQKVKAILIRRGGDADAALVEVERMLTGTTTRQERESLLFERAYLQDRLGHFDAAFDSYTKANQLRLESPAGQCAAPEKYRDQIAREYDILGTAPPTDTAATPTGKAPVFLIGFPRSGTTLLDQVLDSHPDVSVMDERPPLDDVHQRLTALEVNAGAPFTTLDTEQRAVAQKFYFERVKAFMPEYDGGLLVDKLPLGATQARIIKLLFPDAKIVFALRHPCDVVLSSFMQRFTMNMAMANFTTLKGAVELYAQVMEFWQEAETKLKLPVHDIRYEDVVEDFDSQIKNLLDFIGVAWDERVSAFHEHAQNRHVRTASSAQVTQPLYRSALARWEKYAVHLAPHLVTLRPFLTHFGYSTDIFEGN
jgi:tetratricopeptide (TPR) repeat protein